MKPTGNVHRLPEIDSWRRQPQIKNALLHQIKNTTHEIHTIQKEMHGKLTESHTGNTLPKVFEDEAALQVLNDFKAELDQLRRILWFYIEQATGNLAAGADTDQHDKRLQRVNELLRTLATKAPAEAAGEQNHRSISFFERLDVVIDAYMQEKKPGVPAQTKAAKAGS
jgi:dsDNA-binding SOS-regulon protein